MTRRPTNDLWEALYTTRAMRRLSPEPIENEKQAQILDAAIRAPRGGNRQRWRMLFVDDRALITRLGGIYREATASMWAGPYAEELKRAAAAPDAPESVAFGRLRASVQYLADNFDDVPLIVFAVARNDPSGSSVMPAVWSAMLAGRGLGLGSAISSVLEQFAAEETFAALGIPQGRGWRIAATIVFGYPLGRWGVAPREPAHEAAYRNVWGKPPGFHVPTPLWQPRP